MKQTRKTDLELIASIISGGIAREKALKDIYLDPDIRKSIQSMVKKSAGKGFDFIEIFHDAMIIFDSNIRNGKFRQESSIKAYLYAIAKNVLRNNMRKRSRMVSESAIEHNFEKRIPNIQSPEEAYIKVEKYLNLSRLVESLGPLPSKVLEMWQLSYSMKEIAKELNLSSEVMARKIKYKGYQKLLKIVEEKKLKQQLIE